MADVWRNAGGWVDADVLSQQSCWFMMKTRWPLRARKYTGTRMRSHAFYNNVRIGDNVWLIALISAMARG
ncbi:hypothetical protein KCP73_25940 [Salmonella enterica subsp. enterica]|nr:hypothetical protein KCP73_25940 [Salmonella enterica subsp. enterica]